MSQFLSGLEGSGWLKHVKSVLEAGLFVADSVSRGISCLVHCSDGWDRTAQTSSLAALLLDPHYRTIAGFLSLIQRDWLAFGHKFSDRCAHTAHATGGATLDPDDAQIRKEKDVAGGSLGREFSPVFTQWLEAVWQCTRQFPNHFEFTEGLLIELHDASQACQFGTFLGNCLKDREDLKLSERTFSLWPYILRQRNHYRNPLYDEISCGQSGLIRPDLRPQSLVFWRGLYSRQEAGVHPREVVAEAAAAAKAHVQLLKDHQRQLKRRLEQLKKEGVTALGDSGLSSGGEAVTSPTGEKPLTPGLGQLGMSPSLTSLDLSCADVNDPELASIAVRWQSLRPTDAAVGLICQTCGKTFAPLDVKVHCARCGKIHCPGCVTEASKGTIAGLSPGREELPPLCKACAKELL